MMFNKIRRAMTFSRICLLVDLNSDQLILFDLFINFFLSAEKTFDLFILFFIS